MLFRRLSRSQKGMIPLSGGAVIAFVGPEATGKSTLLSEINRWLGGHFFVKTYHAGKPRPTALTAIPSLLVPAFRSLLPGYRSSRLEAKYALGYQAEKSNRSFPLIYAIRCVLIAYDRRSLLSRAFGQAANGTIVLCDRYPCLQNGAPDSPQLPHLAIDEGKYSPRRVLARAEARFYREIPSPDLVIRLTAPLEVAISRNASRDKTEPEDYVRQRHARSSNLDFGRASVHNINTDQPFPDTVREVKQVIWNHL